MEHEELAVSLARLETKLDGVKEDVSAMKDQMKAMNGSVARHESYIAEQKGAKKERGDLWAKAGTIGAIVGFGLTQALDLLKAWLHR